MVKAIGDRDYAAVQGYKYLEQLQSMEKQLVKKLILWYNELSLEIQMC